MTALTPRDQTAPATPAAQSAHPDRPEKRRIDALARRDREAQR